MNERGRVRHPQQGVGDGACEEDEPSACDVPWAVDCETEDTFLYAAITNISEMGIFVQTDEPLAVGTSITLRFDPHRGEPRGEPFVLGGVVSWVNRPRAARACLNPGMGVRLAQLSPAERERIVETIHTIAYLREDPSPRVTPSEPPSN